jgi:hypothetical protein
MATAVTEQTPNTVSESGISPSTSSPSDRINEWGISEKKLEEIRREEARKYAEAIEHNKKVPARNRVGGGISVSPDRESPASGMLQRFNSFTDDIAYRIYDGAVALSQKLFRTELASAQQEMNQQAYEKQKKLGNNANKILTVDNVQYAQYDGHGLDRHIPTRKLSQDRGRGI